MPWRVVGVFTRARYSSHGSHERAARQDLLGGHASEATVRIPRHNAVTGASFVWEQERFDPVTRCIFCYISLRDPASRQARPGRAALLHRIADASPAGIMSRAQPAPALACMCGVA